MLVELGQVGHEIFDDVGVGEGVDAGFVGGVCWDATCAHERSASRDVWLELSRDVHKHASVLTPSIFIAQLPQMPSLQLRLNVKVGSTSFLIRINASSTIGPVLFRSNL